MLAQEVLDALQVQTSGIYVDGTFGRGGHSRAVLQQLGPAGRLLALDQDPQAVEAGQQLAQSDPRFQIVHASFADLAQIAVSHGIAGNIHGILLDLGVSSPQLDDPRRGFSFLRDGPLDMRMNPQAGRSAADWLMSAKTEEIADVLYQYGEERHSRRIARAIAAARTKQTLNSTCQLAEIIAAAHPAWEKRIHPATRSFQAIRIFINRELEALQKVLPQLVEILCPGGRFAIISFHSLEDRLVKRFIRDQAKGKEYPPDLPVPAEACRGVLEMQGKAIRAGKEELKHNPRARSAVLRVARKLAGAAH